MTILFTGGGTMGPVTPLLAVLREMRKLKTELSFAWAGTPEGPERMVVEEEGIRYYPIPVAKLTRYPSLEWLLWPWKYFQAKKASREILELTRPSLVVSAGGFTSVPVMQLAKRLKIPCVIHQLDAEPGLSNRAVARHCCAVTTSFDYDFPPFKQARHERVSTPCRFAEIKTPTREEALDYFGLEKTWPVVFVVGGGTGAAALNDAVWKSLETLLTFTHVIHVTGKGKSKATILRPGYVMQEFFNEEQMLNAYTVADLVISRAGMGGISDLACMAKAAIFVPIPKSHQEQNVKRLPCGVVQQGDRFAERLTMEIRRLINSGEERQKMGQALHDALLTDSGYALAKKWLGLVGSARPDYAAIVRKTAEHVRSKLRDEGTGHDWWHVDRVWRNALKIGKAERANMEVVELAALLHDIADWKFNGNDLKAGARETRRWLGELGAEAEVIDHVCEIVEGVSFKRAGEKDEMRTREGRVVQDADRLDAIGAIGIARCFAYGGSIGNQLHDPTVKPKRHASPEDDRNAKGTSLNHFQEKLLLLKDRMKTKTGRRLADHRHRFMKKYLEEFEREWEG